MSSEQQAHRIAMRQQRFEALSRLFDTADAGQRIDAPERAHVERRLRPTEVVCGLVAPHEGTVAERAIERVDRADGKSLPNGLPIGRAATKRRCGSLQFREQ
jgi:hypothetical protein